MNIVIIGSGNVAASLGGKFVKGGHKIIQVLSRNAKAASELAYEWDTESANYISLVNKEADVYLIAVPDDAIAQVVKDLHLPEKVVAHTAASVKKEVLQSVTDHYGVFYPLQSLSKDLETTEIPVYTEGATQRAKNVLTLLAQSVNARAPKEADYDQRLKLHVAAVIVNNFINHILSLAETYCKEEGIDFADLLPLINNTIDRLHLQSPSKLQTGPAARQDYATIAKHEALLEQHPKLLRLYRFFTDSIINK